LGGDVSFVSSANEGTIFTISLPFCPVESASFILSEEPHPSN